MLRGGVQIVPDEIRATDVSPPTVSAASEDVIRITYLVGTCTTVDRAPALPPLVEIEYSPESILVRVASTPPCDGDSEDVGVVRAARIVLDENVEDRPVSIEQT